MTVRVDKTIPHGRKAARVPRYVSIMSPLLQKLLARGVPIGPNALITIRGRTSGQPRTTPVAIIETHDRRWIWSPWGDTNWALNLRAAGQATIAAGGEKEDVTATELDEAERLVFFRDVFTPYARAMRGGVTFVRLIDQVSLDDPAELASRTRVFELRPAA